MKRRWFVAAFACLAAGAGAQDIKPFQAQEVKPYRAPEIQPAGGVRHEPQRRAGQLASDAQVQPLLGAWDSGVGGAVWTSPSSVPGWETLHVSPGALAGLFVLYPDGRYIWNSYGGKKGRWTRTDDPGYPIAFDDPVERKRWHVGADPHDPGRIFIYDGNSIYYTAKRPR
jgi:hypothetical protein